MSCVDVMCMCVPTVMAAGGRIADLNAACHLYKCVSLTYKNVYHPYKCVMSMCITHKICVTHIKVSCINVYHSYVKVCITHISVSCQCVSPI